MVGFIITTIFLGSLGIFFLFINVALAHYLNQIFAHGFIGYLLVAGFQLFIFLFFLLLTRLAKEFVYRALGNMVKLLFKVTLDLVFERNKKKS